MKEEKLEKARNFCQEVKDLASKYNLQFFVVTGGEQNGTYTQNIEK